MLSNFGMSLSGGAVYYIVLYVIFLAEMLSVWLYLSRKPMLLTTIIDLINKDTAVVHTILNSLLYVLIFLSQERDERLCPPEFLVFILCWSLDFITKVSVFYYSVGISVRYLLVWRQSTCLSDSWTDEEIRTLVRIVSGCIGTGIVFIRMTLGHNPRFYDAVLTGKDNDAVGILINVIFLGLAIALNVIFRFLIFLENRRNNPDFHSADYMKSGAAIFIYVFGLMVCLSLVIVTQKEQNDEIMSLIVLHGISNGPPLVFLVVCENYYKFVCKMLRMMLNCVVDAILTLNSYRADIYPLNE